MREHNVDKVSTPPRVHDATQPSPETATATMTKPGVLVAVVGEPIDGGSPVYDVALGYCVWQPAGAGVLQPMLVQDESTGAYGFLVDDGGNLLYGYSE